MTLRPCRHCGKPIDVLVTQSYRRSAPESVGRSCCTGRRRMQTNPFKQDVYGDDTPELLCDGQAYEAARDV